MRITEKGLCHTSRRNLNCRNRRRIGIPKHENNVEPCIECDRKSDGTRAQSRSRKDGNHLAKILAKKCSGKLYEVTERLRRPVFEEEKVEELYEEILTAAKAPKKDRKWY